MEILIFESSIDFFFFAVFTKERKKKIKLEIMKKEKKDNKDYSIH